MLKNKEKTYLYKFMLNLLKSFLPLLILFSLIQFVLIVMASLNVVFFPVLSLFVCSPVVSNVDNLPKLKAIDESFPSGHFCESDPFKVVTGDTGFVAQCALPAMKILRYMTRTNQDEQLAQFYRQSYTHFSDKLRKMTYTGKTRRLK